MGAVPIRSGGGLGKGAGIASPQSLGDDGLAARIYRVDLENMLGQIDADRRDARRSAVGLLVWMVLPWWIFDNHTVEARHRRIKVSTERRPHHHRNPANWHRDLKLVNRISGKNLLPFQGDRYFYFPDIFESPRLEILETV